MIEIKGMGPTGPIIPHEEVERERLKEIKSRAGKIAFTEVLGKSSKVSIVSHGISRAEGALKWIDEIFGREKWKDS